MSDTQKSPERLIEIACVAHEANRILCVAMGDSSQPRWEETGDRQKASTIHGVTAVINDPAITAERIHESWMAERIADGWKHGAVKNVENKEHPALVPWQELAERERIKDELFVRVVRAMHAPNVFTPEEVLSLNQYQFSGAMHPFTCGGGYRTEHPDGEGILVATIYGWVCPFCDYTQNWAHDFMKNGDWKKSGAEKILAELCELERQEKEEGEKLRERLAKILTDTANELHGGKLKNGLWSWHDLAELAKQQRDALRAAVHALRSYQYGNSATDLAKEAADHFQTILDDRKEDRESV